MKSVLFSVLVLLGSSVLAISAQPFKMINVADLEKSMQTNKAQVYIFDANSDKTREKEGMIPGAKPLASVTSYDAKTVLPANKDAELVFYCANTQCTASHEAAKVAAKEGYKNIAVMSDGILGWKKEGKKTEKFVKTN